MTVQTVFETLDASNRALTTPIHGVLDWFKYRFTLRKDRKEVARLLELDDVLLSDMGLERYDINWALTAPSNVLPSQNLRMLRSKRARDRLARLRQRAK